MKIRHAWPNAINYRHSSSVFNVFDVRFEDIFDTLSCRTQMIPFHSGWLAQFMGVSSPPPLPSSSSLRDIRSLVRIHKYFQSQNEMK